MFSMGAKVNTENSKLNTPGAGTYETSPDVSDSPYKKFLLHFAKLSRAFRFQRKEWARLWDQSCVLKISKACWGRVQEVITQTRRRTQMSLFRKWDKSKNLIDFVFLRMGAKL